MVDRLELLHLLVLGAQVLFCDLGPPCHHTREMHDWYASGRLRVGDVAILLFLEEPVAPLGGRRGTRLAVVDACSPKLLPNTNCVLAQIAIKRLLITPCIQLVYN